MKNTLERAVLFIAGLALFLRLMSVRIAAAIAYQDLSRASSVNEAVNLITTFILLAAAALFVIKLLLAKEAFPGTPIDIPILVFFAAAALSYIYSANKGFTLISLIILSGNIAIFYTLIGCLNSVYRARLFMMILVSAALVASIIGLIHYFFILDFVKQIGADEKLPHLARHMIEVKRIGSVFAWPNILAGFLALIIPISFAQIFFQKRPIEKAFMALVTAALVGAMFLTFSILCWLSFLTATIICGYIFMDAGKAKKLALPAFGLLALLFLLVILNRVDIFTLASASSRIKYLKSVFAMIGAHPVLGNGLDTFGWLLHTGYAKSPEGYARYAHNSYLQIWAETGITGFLSLLFIVGSILNYGIRSLKKITDYGSSLLLKGLIWALMVFAIDNLSSFTILYPQTSVFWWVCAALMFSLIRTAAV